MRTRRQPRCTLCTQHRWRGNSQGRLKPKDEHREKCDRREIREVTRKRKRT